MSLFQRQNWDLAKSILANSSLIKTSPEQLPILFCRDNIDVALDK